MTGAENMESYIYRLQGEKVGLVVNQTSIVKKKHLLDTLLDHHIKVVKIFSPEHGFRGNFGAGDKVNSSVDEKTGVPIVSLYGDHKKPTPSDLKHISVLVFDIQDVGCRFYTYISTLQYVMEAAAENDIPLIVLDRPNPNGYYVDGPVLEPGYESFVGMQKVPVVYGMTIGEYAQMLNGEGWLENNLKCDLTVVPIKGYSHKTHYKLPVPPSPNLPTSESIYLYPSLCFFEGTDVSVGRGTDWPFEMIGKPGFGEGDTEFIPVDKPGAAMNPLYEGKKCGGFKLTNFADDYLKDAGEIYLYWIVGFYQNSKDKNKFFNSYFDKLAGTDKLRKEIIDGWSIEKIRASWRDDIAAFKKIRKKYLLYADFE